MSERLVLGLSGNPGSGKSTIGTYLAYRHGFRVFEGSSIIRAEAQSQGLELRDRIDYDIFYRATQQRLGKAWLSDILLSSTADRLVQVGLPDKDDAQNLKRNGGIVIALVCPLEICFGRVDKTDAKNKPTLEEFIEMENDQRSNDDFGSHTDWVIENATHSIDASQSLPLVQLALSKIVAYHAAGQQM